MHSSPRQQSFGGTMLLLVIASCSPDGEPAQHDGQPAAMSPQPAPIAGQVMPSTMMTAASSGANGGASAAGTGGAANSPPAPMQASDAGAQPEAADSGVAGDPDGAAVDAAMTVGFALTAVGASMLGADEYAFPATALPPTNQSPGFTWLGVPKEAKSLALVFRDLNNSAVKWVIWDIPPSVTAVPANVSSQAMPSEVPGSSQLGSIGNQGYAGPCCADRRYEFVLWALDVDKLPGTARLTTARIHTELLPEHELAQTAPVFMRIMP